MKKTTSLLAVIALAACGGGSPTQSTAPEPAATPAATVTTPATAPATVSAPGGVSVTFGRSAAFVATNTTDGFQLLEAYITNFDDQSKPIAPKRTARVEAGTVWSDSFDTTCVQLDVAYADGKIIAAAFYDKEGKQFGPGTSPERIAACRPQPTPTPSPTPTPTPSPSPTPTPCANVVTYTAQLKLTADASSPNHGDSFFNYHIRKDVAGNNDPAIWSDKLAKGEVVFVDVPADGQAYYAQYDSESNSKTNVVHATCPKPGVKQGWRPSLDLVCTAHNSCEVD